MPKVYGKQSVKPNAAAALCFAASSSPSKSDQSRPDSTSSFIIHSSDSSDDLREISESFVQQIATLTLDQSPVERPRRRAALSARDTNAVSSRRTDTMSSSEQKLSRQKVIEDSKQTAAQLQRSLRRGRNNSEAHDSCLASSSPPQIEHNVWEPEKTPAVVVAIPIHDEEASPSSDQPTKLDESNLQAPEPLGEDAWPHIRPLLDLIHDPQASSGPISFSDWADTLTEHLVVSKIAEASFGEVYRLSLAHPEPSLEDTAESVLKIIALKPESLTSSPSGKKWTKSQKERIESMSNPTDVASESRLLQRMRDVPGFANFRSLLVAQGPLPSPFLAAWRDYNENTKPSEFPDPGKRGSGYLGDDQLWAVLEMEDAGNDLEDKQVPDIWTLWDVFWGVTLSLAKGEEWAGYEHRDLHLGNVCVRRPADDRPLDVTRKFNFTGLETTLIDYTLSRASLTDDDSSEEDVAFFDLATDPAIFQGDATEDYQYAIYRHMRGAVLHNDPCSTASPRRPSAPRKRNRPRASLDAAPSPTSGPWRAHTPLTNLVWLHFVLYKLSEQLALWPSSCKPKRGRKKRSAADDAAHARALELEAHILELTDVLALEALVDRGIGCAAGLVAWAVERAWLDEADVLGLEGAGEEASLLSLVQGVRSVRISGGDGDGDESGSDVVVPARRTRRA